jgi:farnesyl-diphosphate farnesyltransferase
MCRGHLFPRAPLKDDVLLTKGIRFGKGLQLVNILRDLPADLREGRCYLPMERLAETGLAPADLLLPKNEAKLKPLYEDYLNRAASHLTAGWDYTNSLPFRHVRVRLACAWPILLGMDTLHKLRRGRLLDPAQRIKVSRDEVRATIWRTVWMYPLPKRWRGLLGDSTRTR